MEKEYKWLAAAMVVAGGSFFGPATIDAMTYKKSALSADYNQKLEYCSGYVVAEFGAKGSQHWVNHFDAQGKETLVFIADDPDRHKIVGNDFSKLSTGPLVSAVRDIKIHFSNTFISRPSDEIRFSIWSPYRIYSEMKENEASAEVTFPDVRDLSQNEIKILTTSQNPESVAADLHATAQAMTASFQTCVGAAHPPEWKNSFKGYAPTKF